MRISALSPARAVLPSMCAVQTKRYTRYSTPLSSGEVACSQNDTFSYTPMTHMSCARQEMLLLPALSHSTSAAVSISIQTQTIAEAAISDHQMHDASSCPSPRMSQRVPPLHPAQQSICCLPWTAICQAVTAQCNLADQRKYSGRPVLEAGCIMHETALRVQRARDIASNLLHQASIVTLQQEWSTWQ